MGFFGDMLSSGFESLKNLNSEAQMWKERLEGKSDEELRYIAQNGSPTAKKVGASMLLKERGYGR